jgi:alkylation response protein AidB-like acyl-CoA dehydrogenase
MNFEPDPGEQRFRAEVRAFVTRAVAETFPDRARGGGIPAYTRADVRAWTQALHRHGWSVPHWPVEWGGSGWPPLWRAIFEDEINGVQCPPRDMISIGFIGPVLYTFGTEAQKQRFLPRIRSGEDAWCQGFSEPDAGSDVMALRTSAIRQGDQFVVNGRKLWITNAHHADMMFALARIDAPGNRRQQGLSFLLVDMRTPGIRVTPVITIDGAHRLNEVTLDNVRVPIENLVGEQGKGWVYARFLLDKERSLVAQLPALRRLIATLRQTLTTERRCGTPLIDEASWRLKLAQFDVELGALEFLELRYLYAGEGDPGVAALASMLKLRGTELRQRVSEALWDAIGDRGMEFSIHAAPAPDGRAHWTTPHYLFQRSATLAGGSSEIQRNIIAGVSLGL